jgi:hypothetical protein
METANALAESLAGYDGRQSLLRRCLSSNSVGCRFNRPSGFSFSGVTRMRFEAEKTIADAWHVWDDVVRDVTVVDGMPASGLSKEAAIRFAEKLNKLDLQLRIFRKRA